MNFNFNSVPLGNTGLGTNTAGAISNNFQQSGQQGSGLSPNLNFSPIPGINTPGGFGQQQGGGGFFSAGGGAGLALGGIQTIGSLFNSFQQNKLAKKALNFQKESFETNLANSTKSYNTALEDRIRARFATEGRSDQADAKIERDKL